MNQKAYAAIEEAWNHTLKIRALCPTADDLLVGQCSYRTADYYRFKGIDLKVVFREALTKKAIEDLSKMGGFVNRSFVINMVAILQEYHISTSNSRQDRAKRGWKHVQLAIGYRNCFAHGDWKYDRSKIEHRKTLVLLKELFPKEAEKTEDFPTSINTMLEPLKDEVLEYIEAST